MTSRPGPKPRPSPPQRPRDACNGKLQKLRDAGDLRDGKTCREWTASQSRCEPCSRPETCSASPSHSSVCSEYVCATRLKHAHFVSLLVLLLAQWKDCQPEKHRRVMDMLYATWLAMTRCHASYVCLIETCHVQETNL